MIEDVRLETPKQLAARVGVTERQIRHLITSGQLEHVFIGSRVHIPVGAFARFLELKKVTPQCQDATKVPASAGSTSVAATTSVGPSEAGRASAQLARQIANKLKRSSANGSAKETAREAGRVIQLRSS